MPGRKLGAKNAIPRDAALFVLEVFHKLGGVDAMVAWALKYPCEFYGGIFAKLLPKQVNAELLASGPLGGLVQLNVVQVADPSAALTALERLEDARNAHRAGGGDSDGGEVDVALPAHEVRVQAPDGGGAEFAPPQGDPDATAAREDEDMCQRLAVPLSVDVPEQGGDLRST